MHDVLPHGRVHGYGNAEPHTRGEHADVAMREIFLQDGAAHCFTQALPVARGLGGDVVQAAGLLPQAELAFAYVARHALGGGADKGEFEIVDSSRAVHGDTGDAPLFHEVDEVALHSVAQHVRAHHEDHGGAVRARHGDALRNVRQRFGDFINRRKRQDGFQRQIVLTLGQRFQLKSRTVEFSVRLLHRVSGPGSRVPGKNNHGDTEARREDLFLFFNFFSLDIPCSLFVIDF